MATRLEELMAELEISDADLAAECEMLRGHIYSIRKGRKVPKVPTAAKIIEAFRKRGVELELLDLVSKPPKTAKAAPRKRTKARRAA